MRRRTRKTSSTPWRSHAARNPTSPSSPSRPRPRARRMELFGRWDPSGKPEPFHVYSMRQAIEEGFILDVLQHYIDYDTYFRIVKQADDDPELPKRRTAVALAKFLSLHPHNISQKHRSDRRALPRARASPHGAARQGDGRHLVTPAARCATCRPSSATSRSRATTTCARWWPSAARSRIRTRARTSPSPA